MCPIEHLLECRVVVILVRSRGHVGERRRRVQKLAEVMGLGLITCGKERTSVVSTHSLAELYKFAMKEQGRQEDREVESGDQGEETTLTWMAMMMVVSEVRTRLELEPM